MERAGHAVGEELAVEIPDREAVRRRVELDRRVRFLPAQRIEVGDQVATHAVDADQLGDLHLLVQHRLLAVDRVDVGTPLDGLVRHPEGVEDVVVEAVLAEQQLVDPLQEQPRLGALDDAVVVGAGDGDDLGDAERRQVAAVGALELGRVVDGADADDDALAGHQARHRLHRADGARVGQRHAGALEVGDGQLVAPDLADDLLVGDEEAGEVERLGVAEDGNDERSSAVALVDVDREAHVDVFVLDESWLAVGTLEERVVHRRDGVGDRPHDGVADEMGEAHLALAAARSVPVDHLAVDLEQAGRDVAEAGRRRHREAAFHVGGDRRAGTADRRTRLVSRDVHRRGAAGAGVVAGGGASAATAGPAGGVARTGASGGVPAGCGWSSTGRSRHRRDVGGDRLGHRAVVGEELLPRLADRLGVGLELLVHLLDEPRVRPERWLLDIWHCHDDDRTARRSIPRQLPCRCLPLCLRATAAPVTCRG